MWAERLRNSATLEPGREQCDCGAAVDADERHRCVNCGHPGCAHCLRLADDTGDAALNDEWIYGADCEIEWLEALARNEERAHQSYQDWIGRQIETVRARKKGK